MASPMSRFCGGRVRGGSCSTAYEELTAPVTMATTGRDIFAHEWISVREQTDF